MKRINKMTGTFGRVATNTVFVVTGNGNGVAGFGLCSMANARRPESLQKAFTRTGLRLCHIELYENRTVYHDFVTQFGHTRIFVKQQPMGFGIDAHRTIKSACEMIGIKDLKAVVEGSRNYNHIIKAFFLGLLRQRTHQTLADEKGLHLVELREEYDNFPKVTSYVTLDKPC